MRFQKMHGTLNDFVVFHDLEGKVRLRPEQAARICDRRGGVGADGVIVVRPSTQADFFMDYVNADGSVAEMCGNGIRCVAKYVYDNGLKRATSLAVETRAGVKILELSPGDDGKIATVRVDMGAPIFDPSKIPVNIEPSDKPIIDYPVDASGRSFHATILSMGNPHCVIFVEEDPSGLPLLFGPILGKQPLFPAFTNVEFVRVLSPRHLMMRVWERGSGETFSCGTGACATAVAARLKDLSESTVVVGLLGGDLQIEWEGYGNSVV
ncbi:MAG: diaminopimelate epimerase, partial [Deltaproteobacteria bacterium]|nr:diaminopimelate epimerase [Deltaproteobacteria bacterium]